MNGKRRQRNGKRLGCFPPGPDGRAPESTISTWRRYKQKRASPTKEQTPSSHANARESHSKSNHFNSILYGKEGARARATPRIKKERRKFHSGGVKKKKTLILASLEKATSTCVRATAMKNSLAGTDKSSYCALAT